MMSEPPIEPEVPVSAYGAARREAWLAHLRASDEMASAAAMQAHQADHDAITVSKQGLYGHLSPQDIGAAVAALPARVGDAWGQGRPLERNGGRFDHNLGPAPARRD